MNIFKSSRKAEKNDPVQQTIIGDQDDESNYPYEDELNAAAEMDKILGKAVTITEENNGSIISLQRSGTFEMGRRIASMGSKEELSVSDSHAPLENTESFSYASRSSSLQSTASLPSFLKVEKEDPVTMARKSWDTLMREEEQNLLVSNNGFEFATSADANTNDDSNATAGTAAPGPTVSLKARSWSKLRQEIDGEANSMRTPTSSGKENTTLSRSISLGRMGFSLRKRNLKDSRSSNDNNNKSEKELSKNLMSKIQRHRSEGKNSSVTSPPARGSRMNLRYAKEYDVEVSLQEKKSFWKRKPSKRREEGKNATSSGMSKSKSCPPITDIKQRKTKDRPGEFTINNSFETPIISNSTNKRSTDAHDVKGAIATAKQTPKVVVLPTTDILFESMEVVCCHCVDDDETLDMIAESLPPYV
uniref:Uncharacterized protein n=1 Tax=Pseudo-nitzschia australis TaxID=44445 RepID=A0A7S4AQM6_9STRA|mmetsp:Transcript_9402/g.19984  ORF Transcript_9402/g.19984 Transcript_9402/m.19984 type:complete len:418 (+) Transcript_9402:142-1395(+)